MIVIDASATVALVLNEDAAAANEQIFRSLTNTDVIVPSHWPAEVGNSSVMNVRRQRLSCNQFHFVSSTLEKLKIRVEPPPTLSEIETIAIQAIDAGLTYYDAAYVDKARSHRASLFTFDAKMRKAAAQQNIPLLPP